MSLLDRPFALVSLVRVQLQRADFATALSTSRLVLGTLVRPLESYREARADAQMEDDTLDTLKARVLGGDLDPSLLLSLIHI